MKRKIVIVLQVFWKFKMCIRDRYRSENAGMSSANAVRICMAESLRFLEEGSSDPG